MQSTSTLYNNLLAAQNHSFECRLDINGVEYRQDAILSARPSFRVFESAPTIGGVYSSTLDFSLILPANTNIPRMAIVRPFFHVVANGTGSEWYPLGYFYIDTRTTSRNNSNINVFKALCYDVMLKANAEYNESSLSWPATDIDVVREIATKMGTYIDYRTQSLMTQGFSIPLPVGKTYRDVLSYIAVMYCGNWVSSVSGNLLLMPLPPTGGNLDVGDSASTLSTSPTRSGYTKVQIALSEDSENVVEVGSSDDRVMTATCPYMTQALAGTIYNTLSSFAYTPFTANGVWSNPAVELGDTVTINGFSGTVYALDYTFGSGMVMDMSAPNDDYIDHEYAYESPSNRAYKRTVGNLTTAIEQNAEAITLTAQNMPTLNLVPSVYYRENASGPEWTNNGITWTVNSDGTITATGTATADSDYYLTSTTATASIPRINIDPTKKHTYSGVPLVTGCQFRMGWWDANGNGSTTYIESVPSSTRDEGYVQCTPYLRVKSGTALPTGGVTFKPMLEAGATAHEYVSSHNGSYAMQSQIQQNAEDISLKVSQTDYNGNTIASLINQTATTVAIEAQHINLTGAVTISSLDSTTQAALLSNTTVKTQYYLSTSASSATGGTWYDSPNSITWSANHYVWTRVATTKTNASGASTTTYSTAVYDKQLTTALSTAASASSTASDAATAAGNAQTTANATVKEAIPIYYRSMSSTTPTLVPGETYVYVTDNTDDQWSAVAPRPKKGAYFWEAVRYTLGDNSRSYSPVRALTSEQYASKWCSTADAAYIDGGSIYANSVTADKISVSDLNALNATIAGWTIGQTAIYKNVTDGTTRYQTGIYSPSASTGTLAFYVEKKEGDNTPTYPFAVRNDGHLTATDETITGSITATSLTLGSGVSVAASKVSGLSTVATSGNYTDLSGTPDLTIYVQKDGTIGTTPAEGVTGFKVSSAGLLTASNAVIYGTVYASHGTFTGTITSSNATITGGTLNITTSDATSDVITLSYGSNSVTMRPGQIVLQGSTSYSRLQTGLGSLTLSNIPSGSSTADSTAYLSKLGVLELTNSSGSASLDTTNGLVFKDANNNVTAEYPSTIRPRVIVNGTGVSLASATSGISNIESITLTAGMWVIIGGVKFTANATGYRRICLSSSATGNSEINNLAFAHAPAVGSSVTTMPTFTTIAYITAASQTYYLNARQNSGSTLTATGYMIAYRLA